VTLSGDEMRLGTGSFEEGEVAGFSTTVPNCVKAVGVSSSIGIRIDGAGIEGGIMAVLQRRVDVEFEYCSGSSLLLKTLLA
jgi:hypothetical protein